MQEVEETTNYHDQGEVEEAAYEGLRFLLASQTLEMDTRTTSVHEGSRTKKDLVCFVENKGRKGETLKNLINCEGEVNGKNLDQKEEEDILAGPVLQVGKIRFSPKEIKEASDALNLILIENEWAAENKMEKQKISRISAR